MISPKPKSETAVSSSQSLLRTAFTYWKTIWFILHTKIIWTVLTYVKASMFERRAVPRLSEAEELLAKIKATCKAHETAGLLHHLIETDGAGSWPPRASHGDAWPKALRPYHDIYLELAPSLAVKEASLDDDINSQRCLEYRTRMRNLLHDQVDLSAVKNILSAAEAGDNSALPADSCNGFFACVALSRHAFRWGTIPVVTLLQKEKIIDLPPELELPWFFLGRRFGVTSQGGNVTSNFFCNFDNTDQLVYEVNCGMSDVIKSAEYHFVSMFPLLERLALPIYYHMILSIICFERGQRHMCLGFLETVRQNLRHPLKVYYAKMTNSKISHSVWMSHVQGFQGWGAGEVIDGVYVEYDGLSGNQQTFFQMIDAFLGLDAYLSEENQLRYIPLAQRKLIASLKEHSFRHKAKAAGDVDIETRMENIVKQMRLFRVAHRARAQRYLRVPLPERMIMTAGKSVLESSTIRNINVALNFLNAMLVKREKETV